MEAKKAAEAKPEAKEAVNAALGTGMDAALV